jgi:hypothetical protein
MTLTAGDCCTHSRCCYTEFASYTAQLATLLPVRQRLQGSPGLKSRAAVQCCCLARTAVVAAAAAEHAPGGTTLDISTGTLLMLLQLQRLPQRLLLA